MIQELFGATLDFVFILWVWIPGIAVAILLKIRHPLDAVSVGFLVTTLISTVTYSVTFTFGQSALWVATTRWVLLGIALMSLWFLRREIPQLLSPIAIASITSGVAVTIRNVFRLDGWMGDTDHLITLWVAELLQSGDEGPMWGHSATQKKGLTYPILLGLGRDGLFLQSISVVVLIVTLLASYRLTTIVVGKHSASLTISFLLVVAMWATSPMFIGFAGYAHGHVVTALGVAVSGRLAIDGGSAVAKPTHRATLSDSLSAQTIGVGLFVSGFVIAQSRIEGFVLAVLVTLPFLWRAVGEGFVGDLLPRLVASLGGPMGFSAWFLSIGEVPVGLPAWLVFFLVLISGPLLAIALYFFPFLRSRAKTIVPLIFLGGLIPYLFALAGSRNNLAPFLQNTFLGSGLWGIIWWVAIGLMVALGVSHGLNPRERYVLWLATVSLLFTVLVKALDLSGTGWGTIREGWSDSVNRTLFHSVPLVIAVMTLSLFRLLTRTTSRTN